MSKIWNESTLNINNQSYKAVSPLIISASRASDIPAFYGKWLINRLNEGFVSKTNVFSRKPELIDLKNVCAVVFWTKNPKPLIPLLFEFDKRMIDYYFLFTLNNYTDLNIEPNLPTLQKRIETFVELSELIGKQRVIWRFDPLFLSSENQIDYLSKCIENVGDTIYNYTEKLVFSFVEIENYTKVRRNLSKNNIRYIEFSKELKTEMVSRIVSMNKKWKLELASCSTADDFSNFGVKKNACIDGELMIRIFGHNAKLQDFLNKHKSETKQLFDNSYMFKNLKDTGQRKHCCCIYSKDIGKYDTCPHFCTYCYANSSTHVVEHNYKSHNYLNSSI